MYCTHGVRLSGTAHRAQVLLKEPAQYRPVLSGCRARSHSHGPGAVMSRLPLLEP